MDNNNNISIKIGKKLSAAGKTLALAESCTGGFISHLIISVPGSSQYYLGGIISYHNKIKKEELTVRKKTLKKYGAVSAECASEMALGIRKEFGVNFALATTGIAGPTGGVPGKPVGTVYIALAHKKNIIVERFNFKGTRLKIIQQTAQAALEMLYKAL